MAIPWLGYACGACEYCAPGWEALCEHQLNTGYAIDGGHAEYVKANANFVGRVPRGGYPFEAAPLTCAGVTTYKAVKVSGTRPSDLVAVFGVGGLGHVAVQYARISGAAVAVDLFDDKLRLAEELGAGFPVNAGEQDPVEEIKKLGGADAVIATAVSPRAFEQGFGSLKRGARSPSWPAERQRDATADLRDGAWRPPRHGLHRQHQGGSAGGLRVAYDGQDAGDPRGENSSP